MLRSNPRYQEWPYIPLSQKWQPNGVATLDSFWIVPLSQLPPFGTGNINYDTFPTTVWQRLVRSIGTNADTISETGIIVDWSDNVTGINNLTVDNDVNIGGDLNVAGTSTFDGPTVVNNSITIGTWPLTYNNTVTNGTQVFSSTYTGTYLGSTLNYTNVTQNYTAPALISCVTSPAYASPYPYPATTNQVQVVVTIASTNYTVWQSITPAIIVYNLAWLNLQIETTPSVVAVDPLSPWITLVSICFYTGNVINQNGVVQNNTNNTTNNNGSTINNTNTTINGGTYNNSILNNVTITGTVTGAGVKVWPITRTPAWSSYTHTNALATTTSVVNGVSVVSGTVNGNYFDFNTSVAGQITFTSKDFLGNSISENGIVFYYTANY